MPASRRSVAPSRKPRARPRKPKPPKLRRLLRPSLPSPPRRLIPNQTQILPPAAPPSLPRLPPTPPIGLPTRMPSFPSGLRASTTIWLVRPFRVTARRSRVLPGPTASTRAGRPLSRVSKAPRAHTASLRTTPGAGALLAGARGKRPSTRTSRAWPAATATRLRMPPRRSTARPTPIAGTTPALRR